MYPVSYREYTTFAPDSTNEVVENIVDFAGDHGWTIDELQVNVAWTNNVGWGAGDNAFAQLHCNNAIRPKTWRLYRQTVRIGSAGVPSMDVSVLEPTLCDDAYRVYNLASNPFTQNIHNLNATPFRRTYIAPTRIKQWVMGNANWIFTAIQNDALSVASIFFGIPDLLDPTSPVGHIIWKTSMYPAASWDISWAYYNTVQQCLSGPWSRELSGGPGTGFPDRSTQYGYCGTNIRGLSWTGQRNASSDAGGGGVGLCMQRLLSANSWTGRRTMIVPLIYKHPAPTPIFTPFAYMPIAMVRWGGLEIGQSLFYGNEEYKVFPFESYISHTLETASMGRYAAWAVRVA